MSSDQEPFIKINDIIGKTWLATLDDFKGYVLSLKLIEHNSVQPPSPGNEQEEETATETSLQNSNSPANKEHSDDDLSIRRLAISDDLKSYFKENSTELVSFVRKLNLHIGQYGIRRIQYGEEDKTISKKIHRIVITLGDSESKLSILDGFFKSYKNNNNNS